MDRAKNEGFAGLINAQPTSGGPQVQLYCIDINTDTYGGVNYHLGTWGAASVPNVGYVARILNEYFPNTTQPSSLANNNQRAAAVQAAIWFFSDRYVLSTSDPLHNAVAAIVGTVQSEGPLITPPAPSITITPPANTSGPAGTPIGPFTVASTDPSVPITLSATNANMFADALGTMQIQNGGPLPANGEVWLNAANPATATLHATGTATVKAGNVFLSTAGDNAHQKLILASQGTLTTTVDASAQFLAPPALVVYKTIQGPASGLQGQITITVSCQDGTTFAPFIINAKTTAGTVSKTFSGMASGTTCTVTETVNGSSSGISVVTGITPQQPVTISPNSVGTTTITDTYDFLGAVRVSKKSSGSNQQPLAGAVFTISGPNNFSQTVTTDQSGIGCVDHLASGAYTVQETTPPPGYVADDTSAHNVTIAQSADCSNFSNAVQLTFTDSVPTLTPTPSVTPTPTVTSTPTGTPTNTPLPSGAIKITKTDAATGAGLPGATFLIAGQDVMDSRTTGADGTICQAGYPFGDYTVTETSPPPGYTADNTAPVSVTVDRPADCQTVGTPNSVATFTDTAHTPTPGPTSTPSPTATSSAVPPTDTPTVVPATSTPSSVPVTTTPTSEPTSCPTVGPTPENTATPTTPATATSAPSATTPPTTVPGATSTPTQVPTASGTPTLPTTGTPTATLQTSSTPTLLSTSTPTTTSGGGTNPAASTRTPTAAGTSAAATGTSAAATGTSAAATPQPTLTSTPPPPPGGGGSATGTTGTGVAPTVSPFTPRQLIVLAVTIHRLEERLAGQQGAPVQVPAPPVQLPPVADSIYNFFAATFSDQQAYAPLVAQPSPCSVGVSMTNSVSPTEASVGDPVSFTYTVTNTGSEPLADIQVDSAVPDGLTITGASGNGSIDPDSGDVGWALTAGLAPGASTTLRLSATVAAAGTFNNDACSTGRDIANAEVSDCDSSTLVVAASTPTPTVTPTGTLVLSPTPTPAGTGTLTPSAVPSATVSGTVVASVTPSAGTPTVVTTGTPTAGTPAAGTATPATTPTLVATSTPAATNTTAPTNTPVPATNTPAPATSTPALPATNTPEPPATQPPAPTTPPAPAPTSASVDERAGFDESADAEQTSPGGQAAPDDDVG